MTERSARDPFDPVFADLLLSSFRMAVGRPMIDTDAGERAEPGWLYDDAPFGLLAHDGQADPRFIYANKTGQRCFGYTWDELIGLPSRLSAEEPQQAERQLLLDAVARNGFATGYRGVRIAKSGRRFQIQDAVVWELVDRSGARHGQAAILRAWSDIPL